MVAISNERCVLLVDICFYGQNKDGKWFRDDRWYPLVTLADMIESDCIEYKEKHKLEYCSWGIDSRIYVCDGVTDEVLHVGNMLFLDFDNVKDIKVVYNKIALLIDDKIVYSTPDIVKSKNGYHCYFYEIFDFSEIRNILLKPYISEYICDAFLRTTLKLKCSVLRLSKHKKGEQSPLSIVEYGQTEDNIGVAIQDFVRSAIE